MALLLISCQQADGPAPSVQGQPLLDSLNNICRNTATHLLYTPASTLKREALLQGNDLYAGHACYFLCQDYFRQYENRPGFPGVSDSIYIYADKSREYYQRAGRPDLAIRSGLILIHWEASYNYSLQTLDRLFYLVDEAEKAGDNHITSEVYATLGNLCLNTNSPQEALNAFSLQLEHVRQIKPDTQNPHLLQRLYIINFVSLANAAGRMQDWQLSLSYCDSVRTYMRDYPNPQITAHTQQVADIMTLDAFINAGDLNHAAPIAAKLQHICDSIGPGGMMLNYYAMKVTLSEYYMHTGDYDKSLEAVNEAIAYFEKQRSGINLITSRHLKSNILFESKRSIDEAFRLKDEVFSYTDSLARQSVTFQIKGTHSLHQFNKLEKQRQQEESRSKQLLLITVVIITVCLLLIVIFAIILIKDNKLRKKNEKLYERYRIELGYRKEISRMNKEVPTGDTTREPSLFDKLEEYLSESRLWENFEVSREELAMQLGTNREYLIRAIQEHTGMTFNEYINHYRLENAVRMLREDAGSTIKNIYISSGFNNARTFNRLFKQKFGMSPKEFREMAMPDHSQK